jgi:hypothetical protein
MGRGARFGNLDGAPGLEGQDSGSMPTRLHEPDEVLGGEPRRGAVDERMTIDLREVHQRLVYHYGIEPAGCLVEECESRDRAGLDTEHVFEELRLAEAEAAKAKLLRQRLEVDPGILLGDHQNQVAVLVFQEQILGVSAGDRAAQALGLLHGKHRHVLDRGRGDAEFFEPCEQPDAI